MPHKDQPTFKCVQTETLEELLNKYNTNQERMDAFYTGFSQRDERIKYAFDEVNKSIINLTNELDKRKLINNLSKKEREWIEDRVTNIGDKSEKADIDLYRNYHDHERRLSSIEGRSRLLFFIVPILFTVILAIQAINLYWLFQHIA
jgi:hypothetical protein